MNTFAIIGITIFVTIISILLFRNAAGSISPFRLNTVSYAMYFQVLTIGVIGPVLLVLNLIDYHYIAQWISVSTKFKAWLWCMYALLALPFSMNLINHFFRINSKKALKSYVSKQFEPSTLTEGVKVAPILLVISIMGFGYSMYYSPVIPLFEFIKSGDMHQASIDRIASKNEFLGIEYVRSFFSLILIPLVTYYFYIIAYKTKNWSAWILFFLQFLLALFLTTYDLQKSQVAFFLFGFLIVHTFITNGLPVLKFSIVFLSAILLVLIGYEQTAGTSALHQATDIQSGFYGRIFITGFLGFPLSLELFPESINAPTFLFGVPNPVLNNFDLTATDSARELMKFIHEKGAREGTSNLISSYYLGEAWASFGYLGLVVSPFIVGFIVQLVHIALLKSAKYPLFIATYAYISTRWLISSNFSNFLTFKIVLFPLMVLGILYVITKVYGRIVENNNS